MAFPSANADATAPAYDVATITPSDSTVFSQTRGLYIGGGGNLKVRSLLGQTVTFTNVQAGSILPIQVDMVYSTDTTASGIVSLR